MRSLNVTHCSFSFDRERWTMNVLKILEFLKIEKKTYAGMTKGVRNKVEHDDGQFFVSRWILWLVGFFPNYPPVSTSPLIPLRFQHDLKMTQCSKNLTQQVRKWWLERVTLDEHKLEAVDLNHDVSEGVLQDMCVEVRNISKSTSLKSSRLTGRAAVVAQQ